jgi:hypothetical protein
MTFDEQVAALRGKVKPKRFRGRKADATPEQWAAYLDYQAVHYQANREKEVARVKAYREANRGKAAACAKAYHAANREKVVARKKAYREANREKLAAYGKAWREANRGKEAARKKRRLQCDPEFRLAQCLRSRFRMALRTNAKRGSAVRDLGCTVAEWRARLESMFEPGMTWANYGLGPGKWQVDHIYPLAAADLTDRAQFLAVCNYRNLQPLWFEENMAKGDKVTPEAQALFDSLLGRQAAA